MFTGTQEGDIHPSVVRSRNALETLAMFIRVCGEEAGRSDGFWNSEITAGGGQGWCWDRSVVCTIA